MAIRSATKTRMRDIVLSGSLFSNEILADMTKHKLQAAGFRVYEHKFYPATGSALCAGQLYHAGTAK
jgi:hydrogenase maturation factor HypF (carbamoyltransferase family)